VIVSGGNDGTVRCWDTETGKLTAALWFGISVAAVALGANGLLIAGTERGILAIQTR
jgi:WD40 repeat protein